MSDYQNSKFQIRLPLVLCFGLAAGVFLGAGFNTRKTSGDIGKDVQKFRDVLTQIQTEYVDTVNTNNLVDDAIHHMLNKLDPHSAYIPLAERIAANEDLRGNFDGIGVRSEEHTSELQSLAYLVCRLLLEKKKKNKQNNDID